MDHNIKEFSYLTGQLESKFDTIPIMQLERYTINDYGCIYDTKEEKLVQEYYDYDIEKIVAELIFGDDESNKKFVKVEDLMAAAIYGYINLPVINDGRWKYLQRKNIRYKIDKIDQVSDNEIVISNVHFKRYKNTYFYFSNINGIGYDKDKNEFLRQRENEKGYRRCSIANIETSRIHRLVYISWIGQIEDENEVNHIDHKRWNNSLTNLEEMSKYENLMDSKVYNDIKMLTKEEVVEIMKALQKYESVNSLAEKYGVNKNVIRDIKSGNKWKYMAKYADFDPSQTHKDSPNGLTPDDIRKVCDMIMDGKQLKEIAEITGINYNTLSSIKTGRSWTKVTKDYEGLDKAKSHIGRSLNEDQVREICQKLVKGKMPTDLAREYGVSQGTLMKIKERKIWTHISKDYNLEEWDNNKSGKKFNVEQIHALCKDLEADLPLTRKQLAEKHGLTESTVKDVKTGKTWTHISSQYMIPFIMRKKQEENNVE